MYRNHDLTLPEGQDELVKLRKAIEDFLDIVGGGSIENLPSAKGDPNEAFFRNQIHSISYRLEDMFYDIKYLEREIIAEGDLYLNSQGRYEIDKDNYLTSGAVCEVLVAGNSFEWIKTSIEHDGEHGYYATALGRDVSIDGLHARVRR